MLTQTCRNDINFPSVIQNMFVEVRCFCTGHFGQEIEWPHFTTIHMTPKRQTLLDDYG